MNFKGYLGPIGDDLPSLIPLMFALVIFFSAFYVTVSTYNERTLDFESDIAVVQVSASLRGTGFVSSLQDFKRSCSALNVRRPFFSAGLMKLDEEVNVFDLDGSYLSEGTELFKCSNTDETLTEEKAISLGSRIVSRVYPLILQQQERNIPVKLVVVAWRE
jgi:hypothetical protein